MKARAEASALARQERDERIEQEAALRKMKSDAHEAACKQIHEDGFRVHALLLDRHPHGLTYGELVYECSLLNPPITEAGLEGVVLAANKVRYLDGHPLTVDLTLAQAKRQEDEIDRAANVSVPVGTVAPPAAAVPPLVLPPITDLLIVKANTHYARTAATVTVGDEPVF